jgi:hypothetical protein
MLSYSAGFPQGQRYVGGELKATGKTAALTRRIDPGLQAAPHRCATGAPLDANMARGLVRDCCDRNGIAVSERVVLLARPNQTKDEGR